MSTQVIQKETIHDYVEVYLVARKLSGKTYSRDEVGPTYYNVSFTNYSKSHTSFFYDPTKNIIRIGFQARNNVEEEIIDGITRRMLNEDKGIIDHVDKSGKIFYYQIRFQLENPEDIIKLLTKYERYIEDYC